MLCFARLIMPGVEMLTMVKNMPRADLMGYDMNILCLFSQSLWSHVPSAHKVPLFKKIQAAPHRISPLDSTLGGLSLSLACARQSLITEQRAEPASCAAAAAYNALQKPYFIHSLIVQDRFEILAGITFSMRRLPLCLSNYARVFPGNGNFAAQRMPLDRLKRIGINLKLKLFVT